MSRLNDRIALVTGSTSGIGRGIALRFAAEGARVVVHGRDKDRGQAVVDEIVGDGGRATLVVADLASRGEAAALVGGAVEAYGGLDVLVNNAGVMTMAPLGEIDETDLDRTLAINLKAPLLVTQAALPHLAERAGTVINVTTAGAHRGAPGGSVYAAAKAALHLLTISWAAELGPRGVRVNELIPGATNTPMMAPMLDSPQVQAMLAQRIPLGRVAEPADIAGAAVFLASADAAYVTGTVLAVDGGFLTA